MSTLSIQSWCVIKENKIFRNGEVWFESDALTFDAFAEAAYRKLEVNYPKFHKMDRLTRLGWLAAELILQERNIDPYKKGIVLTERNGSIDTDLRHIGQMKSGLASPAVFVYSLPNIALGDICIRNGIKGENTCFLAAEFEPEKQVGYISQLLNEGVLEMCVGGWLDLVGEAYSAFLYRVEGDLSPGIEFDTENVIRLFTSHE